MNTPPVRKGQGDVALTREEFNRRFRDRFYDPAFEAVQRQLTDVMDVAGKTDWLTDNPRPK